MRLVGLLIIIAGLALGRPARSDDATPIKDQSAQIEDLQRQVDFLKAALATLHDQRDQAASALQDALANAAGLKAQAEAAAKRATPLETKP